MNTPKTDGETLLKSTALLADAMRNYDPEAPENAEIEKMRAQQMRALSQDEIEERQRAQAHLMVNAYSPANMGRTQLSDRSGKESRIFEA